MGIKGLTDRNLSFPEIGQIRKGAPKTDSAPGKDLPYFRVEFDEKEEQTKRAFIAKYGAQPTEINIVLPFDDINRCFDAWLEAYTAGRMIARSDGEKYLYRVDVKTGQLVVKDSEPYTPYVEGEVIGTWTNQKTKKQEPIKCKPVGRLKVVIPELGRMAYLTVMTTSVHDIANLSAQLEGFKSINGGRIAGIPLVLRRRPKKISVPKPDGSKARYTKHMLSIEADPAWVKKMLERLQFNALPEGGSQLLPETTAIDNEPFIEDEISGEYAELEQSEEWYPDEETGEVIEPEQKMSVETAGNVTRKDGKKYLDCTSAELADMQAAIKASIEKNGLSEEQKTDHAYKLDAIDTLLAARKAATQEQLI